MPRRHFKTLLEKNFCRERSKEDGDRQENAKNKGVR